MTPRVLARKNARDTAAALLVHWKFVEKQQSLLFNKAFHGSRAFVGPSALTGFDMNHLENEIDYLVRQIQNLIECRSEKRSDDIAPLIELRRFPTSASFFKELRAVSASFFKKLCGGISQSSRPEQSGDLIPNSPEQLEKLILILNEQLVKTQQQLIEMENSWTLFFKDHSRKLSAIKRKIDQVSLENRTAKIYKNGEERTLQKGGLATFIDILWNFINTDLNILSLISTVIATGAKRVNAPPPLEYRPQISPNAPAL